MPFPDVSSEFQTHIYNCLPDRSTEMSNRHLQINTCKAELLISLVPANLFYWVFSNSHLKGWPILPAAETKLLASFQIFLLSHSYQICWNSCGNILKYSQNPILKISIATTLIPNYHYYSNHLLTGSCFHLSANSLKTTVRVKSILDHSFPLLQTIY